jgi:hypothetical protein
MTISASQTALASALRSVAHRYRDTDAIDPFPEAETWAAQILAAMPTGWTSVLERQLAREQAEVERLRAALEKIANIDYRGNRSTESGIARAALDGLVLSETAEITDCDAGRHWHVFRSINGRLVGGEQYPTEAEARAAISRP